MAQKRSYSRYFIILQEDEKGYALASDKSPSGYAKLEIKNDKCKISYYVQNLKKESTPYYMILICDKKEVKKIIKLGELNIDDYGRAEIAYEYQADNVANCGINVDKIVGAGIVKFMNTNIVSIMSGFASTEIPEWKNFQVIEEKLRKNEENKEVINLNKTLELETEENINKEQNNIFEEYEKEIEEEKNKEEKAAKEELRKEDIIKEEPVKEEVEERIEEEKNKEKLREEYVINEEIIKEKPVEDDETKGQREKEIKEERDISIENLKNISTTETTSNEIEEEKEEEIEQSRHKKKEKIKKNECKEKAGSKKDYPKDKAGIFFIEAAKGFEELEGVCSEIKRCIWYKVPVNSLEDMINCKDYNKYTIAYYPMINYFEYIKKFKHFILGYKLDKNNNMKYIVYGILGTKSRKDQPFRGRSGFVTWVPLKEGEESEDSYGYWLMFYDFRNSTIVVPIK
ncbi:hypothetical protein SAMN05428976_105104 [Clostridium sp. USBA 49]|uniref:DUF7922 domain-containing protein n=1 Tax=Clostridium sp. USBA 49 TaxID=1881060 RepID=UPI0009997097|nr:hypothetical protein [Clostridium sp. USBA 49]SKA82772.1 hypothetical protein SAMN05428976_105104 [Clostridium sp. USBA 49]